MPIAVQQLGLLAEIAATYSGFIAVFVIFAGQDGRFTESDKHFIQAMVLNCAFIVTFALLPRVLIISLPEQTVFNSVAVFAACVGAVMAMIIARDQMSMPEEEAEKVHVFWHCVGWALGISAFSSILVGLIYPQHIVVLYIAGLSFVLLNAIWCFIAIVFRKFF